MDSKMYDRNGFLKPQYAALTDSQIREMTYNNDINEIDGRTNFGKGYVFRSIDGSEHDSMDAVRAANKAFFDRIKIDTSHKDHLSYNEIEKAYFDCITPDFDFSNLDIDSIRQNFTTQEQQALDYIQERYDAYISRLIEQLIQQNSSKNTKKL